MIIYHVCSLKKANQYQKTGYIRPPVRGWENFEQAQRMSISTGRKVILRLKFPDNAPKLAGHYQQARVLDYPLKFESF